MKKSKNLVFISIILTILLIIILAINAIVNSKEKTNTINNKEYIYEEIIDNIPPKLTLIGEDIKIIVGEEYKEPGYKSVDNIDGDITSKVQVKSNLNVNKPGRYTITYYSEDSSLNVSEIKRTITVISSSSPKKTYTNTKTNDDKINKKIKDLNKYLSKYKISVGYINIHTNFTYLYNEKQSYFGASLFKTLDAMYLYENNKLDEVTKEKVRLAISRSDNSSHFYLVNKLGLNTLQNYAKSIGAEKPTICNKYFCDTTVTNELTYMMHLYKLINTLPNGDELKSYFVNDYGNYLSYDHTYTNLHKYGNSESFFHDVGIFDTDNPYIIVVLTKEKNSGEKHVRQIINIVSSKVNELNNLIHK